jgi:hypothetical protein
VFSRYSVLTIYLASSIGSKQELIECLDLAVRHHIRPSIEVEVPRGMTPRCFANGNRYAKWRLLMKAIRSLQKEKLKDGLSSNFE